MSRTSLGTPALSRSLSMEALEACHHLICSFRKVSFCWPGVPSLKVLSTRLMSKCDQSSGFSGPRGSSASAGRPRLALSFRSSRVVLADACPSARPLDEDAPPVFGASAICLSTASSASRPNSSPCGAPRASGRVPLRAGRDGSRGALPIRGAYL